jgi:hypothetical protein
MVIFTELYLNIWALAFRASEASAEHHLAIALEWQEV